MKNKLKEKSLELLFTFLGSFPAIFIYHLSSSKIGTFLKQSGVSKGLIDIILASFLSMLVTLGFILFLWIAMLFSFLKRPVVNITFYNELQTPISSLDFTTDEGEPQFLRIKVEMKLKKIQKLVIDWLKFEIQVSTNPKMCKIELTEGFSFQNDDYRSVSNKFICNIFRNFQTSNNVTSVSVDVNILLVNRATGEIKVESVSNGRETVMKKILKNYCKYQVSQLEIKGE